MLENPEILQKMVHETGAHSTDVEEAEPVEHLCGNAWTTQMSGKRLQTNYGQSIHMLQRDTRTSRNISSSNLQMRAEYRGRTSKGVRLFCFIKLGEKGGL